MSILSERFYVMEAKQLKAEHEKKQRLKEIEIIERKKQEEKEKKQYKKDLLVACEYELRNFFDGIFSKIEIRTESALQITLAQFYNVETRKNYIKTIGKTANEQDYIDKIYDKILNEVYKKWQNHLKYAKINAFVVNSEQIITEQKKQETQNLIINILNLLWQITKWIFIIIFGGICLLLKLINVLANK